MFTKCFFSAPKVLFICEIVMYLLDKLKPFEQKDYFSLKEQNGLGWNLETNLPGGSNSGPPGWRPSALAHLPTDLLLI